MTRPSGLVSTLDRRSLVLLALGALSLFAGLGAALALLGIGGPFSIPRLAASHGTLMALGFLGTMIALERAVALGRPWGYLAPLLSGASVVALVLGADGRLAGLLLLAAGVILAAMYVAFDRIEVALHTRTQAVGVLAWLVAATLLLAGRPVSAVTPWLAAFLVLIIAGERLELSRLGELAPRARLTFVASAAVFCMGVALSLVVPDAGVRIAGLGLVALAAWLAGHDLARRTVRMGGVTRYIALCLLIGYAWLALGGAIWVGIGASTAGLGYDAMLHTIFLGFVMSMVFGHAPVIIPAVLRVPLPYRPRFYAHLALLHVGLVVRVVGGDLLAIGDLWRLGGVLNVLALLLFLGSSVASVLQELAARRGAMTSRPHRQQASDRASSQRSAAAGGDDGPMTTAGHDRPVTLIASTAETAVHEPVTHR